MPPVFETSRWGGKHLSPKEVRFNEPVDRPWTRRWVSWKEEVVGWLVGGWERWWEILWESIEVLVWKFGFKGPKDDIG